MFTNQELAVSFQEMETAVIALVKSLELLPEEMYNYMEENARNPAAMGHMPPGMLPPNIQPGMIPPGMLPPGMSPPPHMPPGMLPPGADPMAMLQFQQQLQAQMSAMNANKTGEKKKKDR